MLLLATQCCPFSWASLSGHPQVCTEHLQTGMQEHKATVCWAAVVEFQWEGWWHPVQFSLGNGTTKVDHSANAFLHVLQATVSSRRTQRRSEMLTLTQVVSEGNGAATVQIVVGRCSDAAKCSTRSALQASSRNKTSQALIFLMSSRVFNTVVPGLKYFHTNSSRIN